MKRTALPRRSVSIRLRLTLLYTAILALTLVAFGTVLYVAQSEATYGGVRANLARQAQEFERRQSFPQPPGDPTGRQAPDQAPALPSGTLPGRWTQTRSMTGEVTGRTLDLSDGATVPLSDAGLAAVQKGQGWFENATVEDQPVMIYSYPYATADGQQILQVVSPIGQSQQSLNALRMLLITGSIAAILLAFLLGWIFAGTALDPIHRITQTAREIGAERNVTRRVAYDGPGDEVGELAMTLNEMLAELESTYRQLEGALESQKRFVADASHELRTPLTTVRGNIELLRRQPPLPASERAEILADTSDEVDRLIRLVNQLLVLARADAGQALPLEPVALQPLIEDVRRQVKALISDGDEVSASAVDGAVVANRDALKQVLLILLDNAARHTRAGTPIGVITSTGDNRVSIAVTDNGPGIPPEALPHIFERFYRGEASRSGQGAGLGLSIARELVELQAGTIAVVSRPGEGATFTVTLPAATGDGNAL